MKNIENKKDNKEDNIINNKDSTKTNIYPHLRQNILEPKKNCKDLTENVYYCLTCKCSTCQKCTLKQHKTHKLILKKDYIDFDPSTLEETKKLIQEGFNYENNKDILIKCMENQAALIHAKIDEIKEKKINEINKAFSIAKKNIKELISFVDNIKQMIEKFYINNKKFFNEKKK